MSSVWRKIKRFKGNILMVFQRGCSFIARQVHQVFEEGGSAFYRKVRKLYKLLIMSLFAPLAVYLKTDWIEAYCFVGKKRVLKYKKLITQSKYKNLPSKTIDDIRNKAIVCLRKYTDHKPDLTEISNWIALNNRIFWILAQNDKYDECINICRRVERTRNDLIKEHQLEDLDIEFIPSTIAWGSIGIYENISVYVKAGLLGLRPLKKLVLLRHPKALINNPCYLNYWSQHITIISDPRLVEHLSPLEQCLSAPLDLLMPFHQKAMITHRTLGLVRDQWVKEKRPPILMLSNEDYERGWDCLRSLGVPKDAWFVCLHVRESGWNDQDHYSENFRNADINSYSLAIKAVVDAGGWVIRMGDPSMTPLPEMPHTIDYAHSDAKSDWMDVFLCAQCRFLIGTSSGLFSFAMAFGVPLVMTNFLAGHALYYFSSQDIFIPRICRWKKENRLLSFKELISPPIGLLSVQFYYDKHNIEVIENTPEEIRDVVMEMLARIDGTLKYSQEDENTQDQFKSMIKICSSLYGDQTVNVNARMGNNFLRKYRSLLPTTRECSEVSN